MKRFEFMKQSYKNSNYRVLFKEADWLAFESAKHGDEYYLALNIIVFEIVDGKEKEISTYMRQFDKPVNARHCDSFIKKFLKDKEYRKQFFVNGKQWEDVIDIDNGEEQSLVNARCAKAIKHINGKQESALRFRDFVSLKTFGMDKLSRKKKEELAIIIGENQVEEMFAEFDDEKMALSACKWIARGLKPHLAVRKVKTDAEIANNCHNSY